MLSFSSSTPRLNTESIRNALQRIVCHIYRQPMDKAVWVEVEKITAELVKVENMPLNFWQRVRVWGMGTPR